MLDIFNQLLVNSLVALTPILWRYLQIAILAMNTGWEFCNLWVANLQRERKTGFFNESLDICLALNVRKAQYSSSIDRKPVTSHIFHWSQQKNCVRGVLWIGTCKDLPHLWWEHRGLTLQTFLERSSPPWITWLKRQSCPCCLNVSFTVLSAWGCCPVDVLTYRDSWW